MMPLSRTWLLGSVLLLLGACGPNHIAPFNPRDRQPDLRKYDEGEYAQRQEQAKPSTGSIYSEAVAGYLEDTRAVRTGDIVLIRIDERADAKGGASTALAHEAERQDGITNLLGILPALQRAHPDLDTEQLVALMSRADFSGEGQTSRAGTLTGTIAVRVKKEMPNGDLFIEGTKVVMINNEEYHLYISGVVRPSDIERDNSVQSSLIADAQVEFTGRGDIAEAVERGWLTKILDFINPF